MLKKIFLNERLILWVIVANAVVIFTQECGYSPAWMGMADVLCTLIFIVEMVVKHSVLGIKGYWKDGWNVLDGTLVFCSLPSVVALFMPTGMMDLSFLLILRILRVFRFFRLVHAFPGFTKIAKNFGLALKQSYAVMLGLVIMVVTFSLISCSLFRGVAPEYFGTPFDAIYSTFRIFTGEGWNEIPDTVGEVVSPLAGHLVRLYFCLILVVGCIIGMSLLNSIFVDAMVSDNNDDVKEQLERLEEKIDKLMRELEKQ